MKFSNPLALWGLLLIAVPVIIHLFNFRRYKKYYFSNLSFLRTVELKDQSTNKLRKYLVLASRVLAFSFLIFAIAGPKLVGVTGEIGSKRTLYFLDTTPSMSTNTDGGYSYLELAKQSILTVFGDLTDGNNLMLVNSSFVKSNEDLDNISINAKLEDPNNVVLKAVHEDVVDLIVYSDFQKSTSRIEKLLTDTILSKTFVKLGEHDTNNIFIDTVYMNSLFVLPTNNVLNVIIGNSGSKSQSTVLVRLEKDDIQISSLMVDLSGSSSSAISFDLGGASEISGKYKLIIDDQRVVFDNDYYFVIENPAISEVAIIYDGSENEYLKEVYNQPNLFSSISISIQNLATQDLLKKDLLIFDNIQHFPEWLVNQLRDFDGRILVIPSEKIDMQSYSNFLGFSVDSLMSKPSVLSIKSLKLPMFSGVLKDAKASVSLPNMACKYSVNGKYNGLWETNLNEVALAESFDGRKILLTFPLEDKYTNLHKHALFVPTMYFLAKPILNHQFNYSLSSEEIAIDRGEISVSDLLKIKKDEIEMILPFRFVNNEVVLSIPEILNEPGIYALISESDTITSLAFNYEKSESWIEAYTVQELEELTSGYDNVIVKSIEDFSDIESDVNQKAQDKGLWKYALLLALLFLLSESILLRYLK